MTDMVDFDVNLFQPSENDKFHTLDSPQGTKEINLSAIEFYARLGAKPRGMAPLVGCSHTTIWTNSPLTEAYYRGKAHHEIYLRTILMDQARDKPFLIEAMLGRTVGDTEEDSIAGRDPEDRLTPDVKVEFEFVDNTNNPEIKRLKEKLEARVKAAEEAKKSK